MAPINEMTRLKEYKEVEERLDQKWAIEDANTQGYTDEDWQTNNDTARCYDPKSLMMSFGTVTIREAKGQREILIFKNEKHESYQLPKGRRNLHESPADAAMRETQEETGVVVQPLYLNFDTRIQVDDKMAMEDYVKCNSNSTVTAMNRDIIYAMSYGDKKTQAYRHIYFYAAQPAAGNGEPNPALKSKEDTNNTAHWCSFEKAQTMLTMKAERAAAMTAQILYKRTRDNAEAWGLSKRLLEQWKRENAVRRALTEPALVRAVAADTKKVAILTEAIKRIVPDQEAAAPILEYLEQLS